MEICLALVGGGLLAGWWYYRPRRRSRMSGQPEGAPRDGGGYDTLDVTFYRWAEPIVTGTPTVTIRRATTHGGRSRAIPGCRL